MVARRLGIGIIGAGDVVRRFWLPALTKHPGTDLKAICSKNGRSALGLAKENDVHNVCKSYQQLISRPDVDAVVICTPPHSHLKIAGDALDKGKHVLLEKPLCETYTNARQLIKTANDAPGVFYVTFNNRMRENNLWVQDQVTNGHIGEIQSMDLEWMRTKMALDRPWLFDAALSGGGVLADLGSHLIIIALDMLPGRRRFEISCQTSRNDASTWNVEDVALVQAIVDDRVYIRIKTGWGVPMPEPVRFSVGVIGAKRVISEKDFVGASTDGYGNVIDTFIDHVHKGKQPDLSLFEDTMLFLDQCYASQRTGRQIEGCFSGSAFENN